MLLLNVIYVVCIMMGIIIGLLGEIFVTDINLQSGGENEAY